jgi:ubiquinone/menaquinone biosynthesis C-methylase UbiE
MVPTTMSLREHSLCAPREPWPTSFWGPEPLDQTAWQDFASRLDVTQEALLIDEAIDHASAILDVGGGLGTVTRRLRQGGKRRVLLDPAIRNKGSLLAEDGTAIERIPGIAEQLPFPEGTFDVALATWVLQYTRDPIRAVSEMARVVNEGGKVLIVQAHPDNPIVSCYNACAELAGLQTAHHGFLLASAADVLTSAHFQAIELQPVPATLPLDATDSREVRRLAATVVALHFSEAKQQEAMRGVVADILRKATQGGLLHDDGVLLVARRTLRGAKSNRLGDGGEKWPRSPK